jgi:hypothetical protein
MSLAYNNYLFKCDILYKHNSKSIYDSIQVKNLVFQISLTEFSNEVSLFSSLKLSELDNQNQIFLLYYVNYFLRPNIIFKKFKKTETLNCILILKLFKNNLFNFLFFYHYDLYISLFEFLLQTKSNKKNTFNNLCFKGNILNNSESHFYLNEILELMNIKKLSFNTYFNF